MKEEDSSTIWPFSLNLLSFIWTEWTESAEWLTDWLTYWLPEWQLVSCCSLRKDGLNYSTKLRTLLDFCKMKSIQLPKHNTSSSSRVLACLDTWSTNSQMVKLSCHKTTTIVKINKPLKQNKSEWVSVGHTNLIKYYIFSSGFYFGVRARNLNKPRWTRDAHHHHHRRWLERYRINRVLFCLVLDLKLSSYSVTLMSVTS